MNRVLGGLIALGLFPSIAGQAQAEYTFSRLAVPGSPSSGGTVAFGINDAGQIVGDYIDADRSGGFLATPVPEPSTLTLALFGIGSLGLLGYARRARPDGPATPGAGARPPARVQTPPGDKGGVRL